MSSKKRVLLAYIQDDEKTLREVSDYTETAVKGLREKLKSQYWRLNNLYKIVNKEGKLITFKMNYVQRFIYKYLHNRNVILKTRQRGITTFFEILKLDIALFNRNVTLATIADTKENAQDIFDAKLKTAYDNLPPRLKEFVEGKYLDEEEQQKREKDDARVLKLANGSKIMVGTKLRGHTLQFLHVSEYGNLSAMYPERAKQVKAGAFQAVPRKGIISVESTAEGKNNEFHTLWEMARTKQLFDVYRKKVKKFKKELLPEEWRAFFIGWVGDEELEIQLSENEELKLDKHQAEYFEMLEDRYRLKIKDEQKKWWIVKYDELGEDIYKEYPATPEEAFMTAQSLSIYGKWVAKLEKDRRVIELDPMNLLSMTQGYKINTVWDLGIDDFTAIIWFFTYGEKVYIFDVYENSGEGMDFYFDILEEKRKEWGFNRYQYHFAPHDITVRDFSTGKSRLDYARERGVNFIVTQQHRIEDGISAVRNLLLNKNLFITKNCEILLDRLRQYSRDPKTLKPKHDENSHLADAMRYLAMNLDLAYQTNDLTRHEKRINNKSKSRSREGWNV